ncbi:LIC12192 family sporadic carbohydrate cluster protein [Leptospira limi]|uniref:Sporadic carbohydrate cluster protein, LIC12192 family n=1 Tax=Leptospira limi TaxID=2950023 RepID=A0ABT3M073_9LEPT|nr:LIC12192 family sporadic carbohydrate cluster protein [Leptospira limi]MCW7462993.1 sporadic carbohydrate cluster protein, LIC12192 family [Leptospira limi]
MKRLRGYIFSRPFLGERVPQHVQNIVIRDYCKKFNFQYLLSATEYAMENSFLMMEETLNELKHIDGIVAYSMYQLPSDTEKRSAIYKRVLSEGKSLHFAVEGISLYDEVSCKRIEDIWKIRLTLPNCLNYKQVV